MNHNQCSIEGCESPIMARGWCTAHYKRWRRYGDPTAGRVSHGEPTRFLNEVVIPYDGDDCLIWPYYRNDTGYARINTKEGPRPVHRIVCAIVNGDAPTPKHVAAHECGMGHMGCVNPKHVTWKTVCENQADKLKHGTHNRGSRHPMSKLSEEDVSQIRSMLASGDYLHKDIAKHFNVRRDTIGSISRKENWWWLEDDINT